MQFANKFHQIIYYIRKLKLFQKFIMPEKAKKGEGGVHNKKGPLQGKQVTMKKLYFKESVILMC